MDPLTWSPCIYSCLFPNHFPGTPSGLSFLGWGVDLFSELKSDPIALSLKPLLPLPRRSRAGPCMMVNPLPAPCCPLAAAADIATLLVAPGGSARRPFEIFMRLLSPTNPLSAPSSEAALNIPTKVSTLSKTDRIPSLTYTPCRKTVIKGVPSSRTQVR